MTKGLRAAAHRFVLDRPASIEGHVTIRMAAVRDFLDDFEDGKREGRYRTAALPYLRFRDGAYDIALSSHFLFLYSDHFDTEQHVANISEMLRVAAEASGRVPWHSRSEQAGAPDSCSRRSNTCRTCTS